MAWSSAKSAVRLSTGVVHEIASRKCTEFSTVISNLEP
jgi:hypothetical protein